MSRSASLAVAVLCAVLLASPLHAGPAQPAAAIESLRVTDASGELVIAPDGTVVSVELKTPNLPDALRNSLLAAAQAWRFSPIRIDGKPTEARTGFRMSLAARPEGDRLKVRMEAVNFANPPEAGAIVPDGEMAPITGKVLVPPKYPNEQMMRGVSGSVLVAILVGADGKAEQVHAVQSQVYDFDKDRSDKATARAIKAFEASALAAVKQWRFGVPPERAGAAPEKRTSTVTMVFTVDLHDSRPGYWTPVRRGARHPAPWLPSERTQHLAMGAMGGGGPADLDSPFRLLTPVEGTTLQ